MTYDQITIDWLTLKHRWLSITDGDAWHSQPGAAEYFRQDQVSFVGATPEQTADWVRNGYDLPGFTGRSINLAPSKRKRPMWNENEGQIDRTRLLCGDENYRLTREQRGKPKAAKVEIGYGFLGMVPAEVIGQYGRWCAGLIRKLEAEGLDVQVDMVSRSKCYIQGSNLPGEVHLRVQKENERSDFKSWSAIFAPSGHRHLMFCARAIHADETNRRIDIGFGGSQHRRWSVESDGLTIKVDCDSTAGHKDPTDTLTEQARAAGLL